MIREVKEEDINNGLLEVFIEGYKYHQKGRPDIFTVNSDEELKKLLIESLSELSHIVIIDDNKIVGYLAYKIKGKDNKKLIVDELVIKETYRSRGFGKKLMDESTRTAKENGCNRIELNCWLFNENAIAMYEHIGFIKQRIIYEKNI